MITSLAQKIGQTRTDSEFTYSGSHYSVSAAPYTGSVSSSESISIDQDTVSVSVTVTHVSNPFSEGGGSAWSWVVRGATSFSKIPAFCAAEPEICLTPAGV